MSVDTSKLITTASLNHYYSILDSSIIQPLQQVISNIASAEDIDESLFGIPAIVPIVTSIVVTNENKWDFNSNVQNGTYDADFISRADVSSITDMSNIFYSCSSLTSLDLSNWDVSSSTNMNNMFQNCYNLTSLGDISSWDVSSVTRMGYMFSNCYSLTSLDLSNWDVSSVTNTNGMFNNCTNLTSLLIGGAINASLNLSPTKLTPQAAEAFFTGLSAKTTSTSISIVMPSTAQGADISIATAKGYTIEGIS